MKTGKFGVGMLGCLYRDRFAKTRLNACSVFMWSFALANRINCMKKLFLSVVGVAWCAGAHAGTDFIDLSVDDIYVRQLPSQSVFIKFSPSPENCGDSSGLFFLTADASWNDYTKGMYSIFLTAYTTKQPNLQVEIDCSSSPYKIERVLAK